MREVGSELQVPNHNTLGWNLITTIMSDQASSQKAFNRMVKEKMEEERERDGSEGIDALHEAYCGMHVGVNLRAAEVRGLNRFINEQSNKSVGIDLIVHSTCKLLGHLGVNPEYGRGVIGFPEFLRATLDDARAANAPNEQLDSTAEAISVKLERQVGSQCWKNILYNYIHSLERTKELNNLEKDVLQYLTNDLDKALLKVDSIFF